MSIGGALNWVVCCLREGGTGAANNCTGQLLISPRRQSDAEAPRFATIVWRCTSAFGCQRSWVPAPCKASLAFPMPLDLGPGAWVRNQGQVRSLDLDSIYLGCYGYLAQAQKKWKMKNARNCSQQPWLPFSDDRDWKLLSLSFLSSVMLPRCMAARAIGSCCPFLFFQGFWAATLAARQHQEGNSKGIKAVNDYQILRVQLKKLCNDIIQLLDVRNRGFEPQTQVLWYLVCSPPGPYILGQEPNQCLPAGIELGARSPSIA